MCLFRHTWVSLLAEIGGMKLFNRFLADVWYKLHKNKKRLIVWDQAVLEDVSVPSDAAIQTKSCLEEVSP